ncbi:unnamed protein product [marine sediment metagenome]|uniref:Uncharacterized protein n=1 Tax=marine sediment metagenome TaxID=412755 RepID=X1AI79_9ZZZZ
MWEDWLFSVKLAHVCIGATYVERPWGVYRHWTCGDIGVSKNDIDSANYNTPEYAEKYNKLLDWADEWRNSMACKGCGKKPTGTVYKPFEFQSTSLPDGEQMQVICTSPQQGYRSLNSRAVRGKKYRFKEGTILALEIGDEWVSTMPIFERYEPQPEVVPENLRELPKEPPKVVRLSEPVKAKVPVTVARKPTPVEEKPAPASPKPVTSSPPIDALKLSKAIKGRLLGAGFKTRDELAEDISKTAGKSIKAIKGIGPAALVQIRAAVFG